MPRPSVSLQASPPAETTQSKPSEGPTLPPELPPPTPLLVAAPSDCPFAGLAELSVEAVVQEVLARNPTLAQMTAAWQAATARYPQVTSLDDPTFAFTFGPDTIAPDDQGVEFASRYQILQKYPWPGKLKLRGENALALASAAGNEVEDVRLQLVEAAKDAFADYYLVHQALAVNAEALRLLREFRQNAETRYKTGLVPQQDILQADVEIGRRQERGVRLERARRVTIARLNTLMHLPPDLPLAPPPGAMAVGAPPSDAAALRTLALDRRPDLKALADRVAAEEAALALAHKEFYPDLTPFFMYDRFMGNQSSNRDLATMLGVQLNLPVRLDRRKAAVAEAQAKIAQRSAELARQIDQVNYLVQQAFEQVNESARVLRLYERTILPAARENVKSAQAAYVTGKIPFLSLIEAERDVIGLRDRYYEAVADYLRRIAALERAIGGPPDDNPFSDASQKRCGFDASKKRR